MVHRGRAGRSSGLLVAVCLLALVGPAAASADEVTASSGATQARLTWTPDEYGFSATDVRVEIQRAGDPPVADQVVEGRFAILNNSAAEGPLRVVDLDGDGEPEVIVSVFSGGASCCFGARVYRRDGTGYARSELLALGSLDRLVSIDDEPPLFSTAGEFWLSGAHACAGHPLVLIRYASGTFEDVTAQHRRQLRRDANRWRRLLRRSCEGRPSLDLLGAYVTDLRRLDRGRAAERAIVRARERGWFARSRSTSGVGERAFRRALKRLARTLGAQPLPEV